MERNPTAELMREFITEVVHNAMDESAEYEDDVISDFVFYVWAVNDTSMLVPPVLPGWKKIILSL
jgi:hypothetical protein